MHRFFESVFNDGSKAAGFMDWLDDNGTYHDWFIVRGLCIILFLMLLIPVISFWLITLNVEFFLTKIIFRQSIKIPCSFNNKEFKNTEIKSWLDESLPYFKWTYIQGDFSTPIIFRDKFYKENLIDIRFLTKEERLLFELAWRGNVTFLKNRL